MKLFGCIWIADQVCWVMGQCDGHSLDEVYLGSDSDCLEACRAMEGCLWFTFNFEDSTCVLLKDCPLLAEAACNCVSGQVECTRRKSEWQLIEM